MKLLSPYAQSMISKEKFVALGHIAYYGANVEKSVNALLCELIDENPAIGAALTRSRGIAQQLDLLAAICHERELAGPTIASIGDAITETRLVMQERNELFHSFWMDIPSSESTQIRGRQYRSRREHVVNSSDIERLALRMDSLLQRLYWYWKDVVGELGRNFTPVDHPGLTFYPDRWSLPEECLTVGEQYQAFLDAVADGRVSPEPYEPFDDGS